MTQPILLVLIRLICPAELSTQARHCTAPIEFERPAEEVLKWRVLVLGPALKKGLLLSRSVEAILPIVAECTTESSKRIAIASRRVPGVEIQSTLPAAIRTQPPGLLEGAKP